MKIPLLISIFFDHFRMNRNAWGLGLPDEIQDTQSFEFQYLLEVVISCIWDIHTHTNLLFIWHSNLVGCSAFLFAKPGVPIEVTSMHHRIINPKFANYNTRRTVWGREQESTEFASWQTVAQSTLNYTWKSKTCGEGKWTYSDQARDRQPHCLSRLIRI